jgi:hypothetical protein
MDGAKRDELYTLARDRLDGRALGLGMPILWHLALRGHESALVSLGQLIEAEGPISNPYSTAGLAYRAYRKGAPIGAQNLAMDCFNRGDLRGYRMWLRRAARAGDQDAGRELKRFETRLPHRLAGKIRRKRPRRRYDC